MPHWFQLNADTRRPNMLRRLSLLAALAGLSLQAQAQDPASQADSFANIYASTCLKHLPDLGALTRQLDSLPSFPPEKAAHFLQGQPGRAWPVPDKHGVFVLAIPTSKQFCSVFARRLNPPEAISRFKKLVETAPSPLVSRSLKETSTRTGQNGVASTLSYEWSVAGAGRKMLFTLTTADSPTADIQGLASAAYVR